MSSPNVQRPRNKYNEGLTASYLAKIFHRYFIEYFIRKRR